MNSLQFAKRNMAVIGYIILAIVFAAAIFRVEQVAARQTEVQQEITETLCNEIAKQNQTLIQILESASNRVEEVPEGASDALRKYIESEQASGQNFAGVAQELLRSHQCVGIAEGEFG